MKDLQKKFLTVAPTPYSIPSTQQILTDNLQLPLQHLNQVQMPTNYVLGGLPLQNSSDYLMYNNPGLSVYSGNLDKGLSPLQIPQDISTAYSGIGQSLHNHVTSYHPLGTLGSLGSLGSPLLISNINSLPPLSTHQMSLQVQNMPIIPTSNISKPQISSSSEKSRSTLLDNFRSNLLPLLGLADLTGHVLEFAKDQHGSRFIQQKLEMASKAEKDKIFDEIFPSILSLMTDVFGNYVIQKFVEHGSEEHQRNILVIVLPNVESLTVQMYGCRVIQKLLDASSMEQRKLIFRKLEPKLEDYIQDHNGNHVIQKCIEVLDGGDKQIILDRYAGKTLHISCHPYGCRIVQRLLEHCCQNQTKVLLAELLVNTDQLILDQYGNYVIQHILDHGEAAYKSQIVGRLEGRVLMLSQHKFASNVVEKCVSNATCQQRTNLISEICADESSLGSMIKDQYGNYVVQKMIETAGEPDLAVLMSKIKSHCNSLHKFSYGKYILAKLETYFKGDNGNGNKM